MIIKKIVSIIFFLFLIQVVKAQDCNYFILIAKKDLNKNNLKEALNNLQNADKCDVTNKLRIEKQKLQIAIFSALEKQKKEAIANLKKYEEEKNAKVECEELQLKTEKQSKRIKDFNIWMEAENEIVNKQYELFERLKDKEKVNDSLLYTYGEITVTDSTNYVNWIKLYHVYSKFNNNKEKINSLKKALELKKDNVILYSAIGRAFYNDTDYERAIINYSKAIELDPSYKNAYSNRAYVHYLKEDYEESIVGYTKAIELDSSYADGYLNRGVAFSKLKKHNKAIENYNKAIEINPKYILAYMNRGKLYNFKKKHSNALKDFNTIIELSPKNVEAITQKGRTYRYLKKYDKAFDSFKQAVLIDPKYAHAYEELGLNELELKEYSNAIKNFNLALQLNPKQNLAFIQSKIALATRVLFEKSNSKPYSKIDLDFYPGYSLEKHKNIFTNDKDGFIYSVSNDTLNNPVMLYGTSPPLHKMNKEIPLQLSNKNIINYLEFFCKIVQGDKGSFLVINSKDDIIWLENTNDELINEQSAKIDRFINKTDYAVKNENDSWVIERVILYYNSIFKAKFKILKNGNVQMLNDEPLLGNLPVKYFSNDLGLYKYKKSEITKTKA